MRLRVVPLELAEANAFVTKHHRHHRPVVGATTSKHTRTRKLSLSGDTPRREQAA